MPQLEAMDAKLMLFWLAEQTAIWCMEPRAGDDLATLVAASGYNMAKFVHTCDGQGLYMTDAGRETALEHGTNYAFIYNELARRACEQGRMRWKIRPKLHGFLHMLDRLKA